jgi:hypothetical protein
MRPINTETPNPISADRPELRLNESAFGIHAPEPVISKNPSPIISPVKNYPLGHYAMARQARQSII